MDILKLLAHPKIIEALTVELEHTRVDPTQAQSLTVNFDGNELLISEQAFSELRECVRDLFNAVNGLKIRQSSRYEAATAISSRVTCQSCIHRCVHTNLCTLPELQGEWRQVSLHHPGCAGYHNVDDYADEILAEIADVEEEF